MVLLRIHHFCELESLFLSTWSMFRHGDHHQFCTALNTRVDQHSWRDSDITNCSCRSTPQHQLVQTARCVFPEADYICRTLDIPVRAWVTCELSSFVFKGSPTNCCTLGLIDIQLSLSMLRSRSRNILSVQRPETEFAPASQFVVKNSKQADTADSSGG